VNKFTLILGLLFSIPLAGYTIDKIDIQAPAPNQRYRDLLYVEVILSGHTSADDTVRASVGNQMILLTYDAFRGKYSGQLSLAGMAQGLLQLVILAKSVAGDTLTATTTFIYDKAPVVTVESPIPFSAYQSQLHIKATVKDPGNADCQGIVSVAGLSIPFINSIDTLIDPTPAARAAMYELDFYGIDSLDQVLGATIFVYTDKSSYLTPVYTDSGWIADVDSTGILRFADLGNSALGAKIYNTITSTSQFIHFDDPTFPHFTQFHQAGLCKGGAFFVTSYFDDTNTNSLYLWHEDSLINISRSLGINNVQNAQAAGNILMWTIGSGKTAITDLTTLYTILPDIPQVTNGKELSKDGKTIVYAAGPSGNYAIYSYLISNKVTTKITTAGSNVHPVVDGNNIAYAREVGGESSIYLREGATDYDLADANDIDDAYAYRLSDGYMAFKKLDSMSNVQQQIWLRTPAKELKKVTSISSMRYELENLGPDGRLVFSNTFPGPGLGYMRYYYDSVTAAVPISGTLGKTYFVHDSLYLALGGTLFAYHIPRIILPPEITAVTPDSAIRGSTITIKGLHFNNATNVKFGDTAAASYTIVSDSVITAIVGGGSSGDVSVTTPVGTDIFSGFHFVFTLPSDFCRIAYTDVACRGAKNGRIFITTSVREDYRLVISGATNIDTLIDSLSWYDNANLGGGSYNICLSLVSHPEYQQCFTAVITEPEDLSTYIAVNNDKKQVTLSLTGAVLYHVKLNDTEITTAKSQITLDLKEGLNKIAVSTDKPCQGTITKNITIGADLIAYPNPFQKTVHLNIGKETVQKMVIMIYNASGKMVYTHGYSNQSGVVTIDLPDLSDGLYLLKLVADNQETIFKLMKK